MSPRVSDIAIVHSAALYAVKVELHPVCEPVSYPDPALQTHLDVPREHSLSRMATSSLITLALDLEQTSTSRALRPATPSQNRKLKMQKAILPIFAALSLAATPAAFASDKFEFAFDFSPVEVASAEGAEKIYSDLEEMIEKECKEPATTLALERLKQRAHTETCIDEAISDAVAQIQSPELTKVHKAKRG